MVFWKLVLLISATTLTSDIFTHTPTNVSLVLNVAAWVWTMDTASDIVIWHFFYLIATQIL